MIGLAVGAFLITALVAITDPVTEIPFGLDQPVTYFITTVHDIIVYMPWFGTIWNVFIIGLVVKVMLFTFQWLLFAFKFARGGA